MGSVRQELRARVVDLSGGVCEFPQCGEQGSSLAHLHSIGAGGRQSADTLSNVMWACRDHARITDGEYGSGGRAQYVEAHNVLFGGMWPVGWEKTGSLAWERAEALTAVVARKRGWAQ